MSAGEGSLVVTGIGTVGGPAATFPEWADLLFAGGTEVGGLARVVGFDAGVRLGSRGLRYLDRCTQLGLVAASEALADARVSATVPPERQRLGAVVSSGLGVLESVREVVDTIHRAGTAALSPMSTPNVSPNVVAAHCGISFVLRGPNLCCANGFASALDAVTLAVRCLRLGRADCMLVVGVEGVDAAAAAVLGSGAVGPLAGLVPGEGAVAMVVEGAASAARRGARARAVIAGCGLAQDSGRGGGSGDALAAAIVLASRRAGGARAFDLLLSAEDGAPALACAEAEAIVRAGLRGTRRAAVKAWTGESYGAAGLFELAAGMACLERQEVFGVPPGWLAAAVCDEVAPLVRRTGRASLQRLLAVAHGPGEQAAAVVLERA